MTTFVDVPAGEQSAISVKQCNKSVALANTELEILKGINLEIKAGESVAIVGRSGSGKTTLLGLLAGLDLPSSGELSLFSNELTKMDEDQRAQLRAQSVGFVFQSFHLLPGMTALENVMLPLELNGDASPSATALNLLEKLGLAKQAQQYPPQLSGGEQQRVALARAVACRPKILFADEPTGNLDTQTGHDIIDLLFSYNKEDGMTLVLVTHDQELAQRCDRQLTMRDGELSEAKPEMTT